MKISYLSIAVASIISQMSFAEISTPTQELDVIEVHAHQANDTRHKNTSATKFGHDMLDVPFSRSFIDQDTLQIQDIQKVDDVIDQVSGVFRLTDYGGGFWDNYSFRGFSTDPDMGATTVRNGLGVNRGINSPKEMVNVESLDFLKGASASLYGRGEVGGVLNVNTKKPKWEQENILHLRGNTQAQYRISFEHTAPINDQFAYRIAVAGEDNHSFRDYVYNQHWFISPQLTWKISDQTTFEFDSEFLQRKGLFDRGISTVNNQFVMDKSTYTGEPDTDENTLKDQFVQLRLNHQFNPNWKINSAISYKHTSIEGTSTEPRRILADNTTLARFRRHRDNASTDIMAQADILGSIQQNWARHDLLASAEIGNLEYKQHLLRRNPIISSGLYINPIDIRKGQQIYNNNLYQLTSANENEHFTEQQRYIGLNLQDQMFFNDNLSALIGLRFDYVDQQFTNHNLAWYNGRAEESQKHHQFSPRFGLNYKWNDKASIYANYGRAFAMNSRLDKEGNGFAPERGTNYEIGTKYHLNDQLSLNTALFYTQKRNILVADPANEGATNLTAGQASSKGLEMDLHYQVNPKWSISANYAYTDAQIDEDVNQFKGAKLNGVAKHSGTVNTNYEFLQQDQRKAGVGGSVVYVGERLGHYIDNGFMLPSYTLVNVHGYYAPSDRVRYQLNINNLLNKDYYLASYSNLWIQAGEPLNASLALTWKF